MEQHEITEEEKDLGLVGGRKNPNETHQCVVDASKIERIRYAIAFSLSEARLDQGTEKDLQKMDKR